MCALEKERMVLRLYVLGSELSVYWKGDKQHKKRENTAFQKSFELYFVLF